jgi:hypothetical protein
MPATYGRRPNHRQNPLSVRDFSVPGITHAALPELLALGINSYAPLMLVFGFIAALNAYSYHNRLASTNISVSVTTHGSCHVGLTCISHDGSSEALRRGIRHVNGLGFLSWAQQFSKVETCAGWSYMG